MAQLVSKLGHCGGGQQKQDWNRLDQSVKHGDGALQQWANFVARQLKRRATIKRLADVRRSGEREELLKE